MRNKTKMSVIAVIFLLIFSAVSMSINTATALDFYPYIAANPNPVGLNQRVLIIFGYTMPTAGFGLKAYEDWTLIVTDPTGHIETMGPYDTESTGTTYALLYPDMVGDWKIQAYHAGTQGVEFFGDITMDVPEATTEEITLTVQQDPIPEIPGAELPSEYWEYPIHNENRNWGAVTDNWLMPAYDTARQFDWGGMSGPYAPYTTTPDAPHIMWTKPTLFGGSIGGPQGDVNYYTGLAYRRELQPPVIINGRLYYNQMEMPRNGFYCVDIYTGETIWYRNASHPDGAGGMITGSAAQITLGQILTLDTRNWHGGIPYLWCTGSTTWAVRDAWTGDLQYTIVNAPRITTDGFSLAFLTDCYGSLYTLQTDLEAGTISLWNSSKMINDEVSDTMSNIGREQPQFNIDWNAGIEYTVPISLPSEWGRFGPIYAFDPKNWSTIIISNQAQGRVDHAEAFENIAVDTSDGSVKWRTTINEGTWEYTIGGYAMSMEENVYTIFRKETRQTYAYRVSDGQHLWTSDPTENPWAVFTLATQIAYGKVYVGGYEGMIHAYNAQTGITEWTWGPIDAGVETPYGTYPVYGGIMITDGKIWVCHGEHSADTPLYRGEKMYALDPDNGNVLWEVPGWYQQPVAANGFVLAPNAYDGKIYCFGKGPSKTTVTIQDDVSIWGDSVLVKGMVTDISAGTEQHEQSASFPNGVPAIADNQMSDWMEYVYMQKQPMPSVSGVEVILETLDPNYNYYEIGRATSDGSGMYKLLWEPLVPGEYTIIARFEGTDSYWGSSAETAIAVVEAGGGTPIEPEPPTEQPTEPEPEAPFITTEVAIIAAVVVIAIVATAAYWVLRRRK